MKIEWDSDNPDGRLRRTKASTVHGWLAKMRGTLLGNEKLRSQGMREMRDARIIRAYTKEKKAQRRSSGHHRKGGGVLSLFGGKKKSTSSKSGSSRAGQRSRHHATNHRLVGYVSPKPKQFSRGSTSNRSRGMGSRHTHQSTSRRAQHKK